MDLPVDAPLLSVGNRNTDERSTLVEMLDFYRTVFIRKTWGLTPEQLHLAPLASSLTLGRLLSHMAFVEDHWFPSSFAGEPLPEPWARADFDRDPDWEMSWGDGRPHHELVTLLTASIDRARDVVDAQPDLGATGQGTAGHGVSLRWILVHMIEEYARHVGHADMIRESLDEQVGD